MASIKDFKGANTELPGSLDELLNGRSMTLAVPPGTDLYASPPLGYHFSAPMVYIQVQTQNFGSARITASVPYTGNLIDPGNNPTLQFDQAGLVFVLPHPKHPEPDKDTPGSGEPDAAYPHPKWVKAGVEIFNEPHGSIVSRDRWSDWSLFRIEGAKPREENGTPYLTVTYEFERVEEALVISHVVEDKAGIVPERKYPVREVVWFFLDEEVEKTLWVGMYGARPDPARKAEGKALQVIFEKLLVRDKSGADIIRSKESI